MSNNRKAVIRFDGGCIGNPGRMYGSYNVSVSDSGTPFFALDARRFDLGHGTNNVAEFESLIMALMALTKAYSNRAISFRSTSLHVITDSMIVRNRLMGKNKVSKKPEWAARSKVMFNLASQCLELMRPFESFVVEWEGRAANVEAFGH